MAGANCPKCGKHFSKAASLGKWHGWCLKPDSEPVADTKTLQGDPFTGFSDNLNNPFAEKPAPDIKVKRDTLSHLVAAEKAGEAAAKACTPEPMHVVQRANPLDDSSPVVKRYAPVMAGVCGFAWISLRGGTRLHNQMKRRYADRVHDLYLGNGYPTGKQLSVMKFGQSMERKAAYAHAYAKSLRDNGYEGVYAGERMD